MAVYDSRQQLVVAIGAQVTARPKPHVLPWLSTLTATVLTLACAEPEAPEMTEIFISADRRGLVEDTTNLGYVVALTEARLVMENLELAVNGQPHGVSWHRLYRELLAPVAFAHPEHLYGGEVVGTLPGRFVVDWLQDDRARVGLATLRVDRYASANFVLGRAALADGLNAADPLLGHTALLSGTATRNGFTRAFRVLIDSPLERMLVGVPFDVEITAETPAELGFQLLSVDPFEHDSLFDDVDFAALDPNAASAMELREDTTNVDIRDAYYAVRRRFQTHDHFRLAATN